MRRLRSNFRLRDLVVLQVADSFPLVLTADELYRAVSESPTRYRAAITLGKRWANGQIGARPLPTLAEADRRPSEEGPLRPLPPSAPVAPREPRETP